MKHKCVVAAIVDSIQSTLSLGNQEGIPMGEQSQSYKRSGSKEEHKFPKNRAED